MDAWEDAKRKSVSSSVRVPSDESQFCAIEVSQLYNRSLAHEHFARSIKKMIYFKVHDVSWNERKIRTSDEDESMRVGELNQNKCAIPS